MSNTKTERRTGKTAKGLLAAGLGAALLLGTGGTFALWQASDTVYGNTFETGHLRLKVDQFDWTDRTGNPVKDSFIFSPGERVVGMATVTADLSGTNLRADLMIEGVPIQITGPNSAEAADPGVTVQAYIQHGNELTDIVPGQTINWDKQFGAGTEEVTIVVEVSLPKQEKPGQYDMDYRVSIPSLAVVLSQVAP